MADYTEHAPGTFCWVELMTSDAAAAKAFYCELMSWTYQDDYMGENQVYTMLQKDGKNTGALYQINEQQAKQGIPPNWGSYVTVTDTDATVAKARAAGANVILEPLDVADIGRMAVMADPTGAVFSVWQPKKGIGATVRDEPGSFCWNELMTNDTDKASAFYTEIFGWQPHTADMGGTQYTSFMLGECGAGGMLAIQKEWGEVPPNWMVYFAVTDCDATVAKAATLGGKVHAPAVDIPTVGRFAVLADPQGAVFGVITLEQKS